jgi:hypothetical protein
MSSLPLINKHFSTTKHQRTVEHIGSGLTRDLPANIEECGVFCPEGFQRVATLRHYDGFWGPARITSIIISNSATATTACI